MFNKLKRWLYGDIYANRSYGFLTKTSAILFANEARRRGFAAKITTYKDIPWGIMGTFSTQGARYFVGVDKISTEKRSE